MTNRAMGWLRAWLICGLIGTVIQVSADDVVSVVITGSDGLPLADVVLLAPGVAAPDPQGPLVIDQVDLAFVPHVLVAPTGKEIVFPNSDRTRHHVYSFSAPNQFELKLYRAKDAPPVSFSHPGVVELGCNIHDQMKGYIYVTDVKLHGVSNLEGVIRLPAAVAGLATVQIWHPVMGVQAPLVLPFSTTINLPFQVPQAAPTKSDLRDRLKKFKRQADATVD